MECEKKEMTDNPEVLKEKLTRFIEIWNTCKNKVMFTSKSVNGK